MSLSLRWSGCCLLPVIISKVKKMKNSLRIMVVLPMYGGSLPIGIYCANALREIGMSVRVFDAQHLYPAFTGISKLDISPARIQSLENSFLRLVSQAVWAQAEEQKPQIVLALAQAPMDKRLLERLRAENIATVMWFVEDYRVFTYWRTFAPLYDAFAVIQKEPFLSELHAIGQKHAFYLPLAALPHFHKKLELTPEELKRYGSDISFLGAGYPNRRRAFKHLANKDFKIWGSDWDGEETLAANIQLGGRRIEPEESVKIYNASKINLNLHSSINPDTLVSHGDFVNPRTFELASMEAFQLADKRTLMDELFKEDEIATFENMDEMLEKADYFLNRPEEREKYAKKARIRVLKEHTYHKRMKTLVEYMENSFGPFKSCSLSYPPDFLNDWKDKIAGMIHKLGLAPDASFEDITARIRQQSGTLTEVETALLFLDEWQKQYKR